MMTDREKRLSLALDALVQVKELLKQNDALSTREYYRALNLLNAANGHIEAAAMPKPGIIRRLQGRIGRRSDERQAA